MKLLGSMILGMILAFAASVYMSDTLDKVLPLKCYTTGVTPKKLATKEHPLKGTFEYEVKRTI